VSCAETQQPEIRLAIQSPTKTRFLSANQVEVFCCCSAAMAKGRKFDRESFRELSLFPSKLVARQNLKHVFVQVRGIRSGPNYPSDADPAILKIDTTGHGKNIAYGVELGRNSMA
jgi:hypothetical protein